jgi:hypothetical protein
LQSSAHSWSAQESALVLQGQSLCGAKQIELNWQVESQLPLIGIVQLAEN